MDFQEHDTVEVFGRTRAQGPPYNGMRGFIDEVYGGGMYSFSALSGEGQALKPRVIGVGGCHRIYLRENNDKELVDAVNTILYEREARYNEMMGKYHLKNIIEDKDE